MSPSQSPLRSSLLVTGAVLVWLGQWLLEGQPSGSRPVMFALSALGALLFLIPVWAIVRAKEEPLAVERLIRAAALWFRVADWQFVALLVSPFLSVAAFLAAGETGQMTLPLEAVLAWVLAIAGAVAGSWSGPLPSFRLRAWSLMVPLGLVIAAFLVRGIADNRIPILLTGDEGSAGIAAVRFADGVTNNPFIADWFSFPALYFYIQSLSIHLFGQTTQALRLPSALAGALTVGAAYFTGRTIFDRRAGLLAAIFLAAFHYHVNFSRIGLNDIWDGLWYTIVIGAVWYGWQREQLRAFTLAGFCLGIAQYFYPSGRVLLVPILGWLLIVGLLDRPRARRMLPGVVSMLLVSLVIVLPLGIFYARHPDDFMAPFNRVSLFGPLLDGLVKSTGQPAWQIVVTQVGVGLEAFTYTPLRAWYTPGTPMLLAFPASLFLLGLLLLLLRSFKDRFLLLGFWIFTFGLIGGLSESTPAAQRYIAAAPVCALLVGYGLSETAGLFEKLWPRLQRPLYGAAIAVAVLMAVNELYFYFWVYTPKTVQDWSHENSMVAQRLANYLQGKPSDLEVVFYGQPAMGYYSIPSLQFLAPEIQGVDAQPSTVPVLAGRSELVFVFLPNNQPSLAGVQARYPEGKLFTQIASDGKPLYWYYEYHAP